MSVLDIAVYRKAPFKKREGPLNQSRYFCIACDGDTFKLMSDGLIRCISCVATIRNLRLIDVP